MNRQGISELFLRTEARKYHQALFRNQTATERKRKILMLSPSLQEEGGMGTVARLIVQYASQDQDIHHICTWNKKGSTKLDSQLGVIRIFLLALMELFRELLFNKVDLVHLHMSERGSVWRNSVFAIVTFIFRKPVIIHTHGAEFHLFYQPLPSFLKAVLNWVLQNIDCLIVLSESWKKFYVEECLVPSSKVVVLNNPVEFPEQVPDKSAITPIKFLFLGKINQRKGIYDLLNAFSNFKIKTGNNAKLLIAGSGEVEAATNLARDLGIFSDVEFLGWITPQQRDELLSTSHSFVLPSYNEGLPMALLEAMSWGLATISTPVGGIGEVVIDQHNGLLVEPGNVEQLAKALELTATDFTLRDSLGREARNKLASFSINNYTNSLSKLYRKTVKICNN